MSRSDDDDYDDDDDNDDEEGESEFVYRRGEAQQAGLEALVRAPAVVRPAPTSQLPAHLAADAKKEALPSLCAVFMKELDEIKAVKGVTVAALAKGLRITVPGPARFQATPAVVLSVEVPADYPKTPAEIHLLPPLEMEARLAHLAMRGGKKLQESRAGQPVVAEVVLHLSRWLADPAAQRASQEEALREQQAQRDEEARLASEAEAKRIEDERRAEEAEIARLDVLVHVRWSPLTAAEELQRSMPIVAAPCKVLSDLPVPHAFHFSAARVGGRLFMYGGTVPRPHVSNAYSSALHILHIASRHVEVHPAPLLRTVNLERFPVMLTNHASCAVGRNVFLFGGLQTYQKPATAHPEPFAGNMSVWELDTSSLQWRHAGFLPEWRQHCTVTPLDGRRIAVFGGSGARAPEGADAPTEQELRGGLPTARLQVEYFNTVLVYDTVTGAVSTPKLTSATGKFPAGRYGHTAVLWQNKLIVYGGRGYELYGDVWVLDAVEWVWYGPQRPPRQLDPHGRAHHAACVLGGQMAVYGGELQTGHELNDLLVYDIVARSFKQIPVAAEVEARAGHAAFLAGGTLFVLGGARTAIKSGPKFHGNVAHTPAATCIAIALAPAPVSVPPTALPRALAELRTAASGSFTDVLLGPQRTPAHAFLLSARCPALAKALTAVSGSSPVPIAIPGIDSAAAAAAFVDFIYRGNPFLSAAAGTPLAELCATLGRVASELNLPVLAARAAHPPPSEATFDDEVLADLAALAKAPAHADFAIVGGSLRLPVSRALLACRSEYFRAMLAAGMTETVKGEMRLPATVSESCARAFHDHLYTDDLDPECAENVIELLPFGALVQIPRLSRLAERLVVDAYDLADLDSVLALAQLAEEHRSPTLLSRCLFLIAQHFTIDRAMQSEGWAGLKPEVQLKAKKLAGVA